MATTNVPAVQFNQTGLVLPLESAILSGVQTDINLAFGGGVNQDLATPQGQLASSTTAIIGEANNTFALFVNQINPDFADGFMQDAIARIYFLNRKPSLPTVVQCDCTGAVGAVIPVGSKAKDTNGNIYISTSIGIIPISGTVSIPFQNIVNGPVNTPANTLTKIYQSVSGWNTVNNPSNGVAGAYVETRADFSYRRQNSVALNAHGSMQSIYAAVFNMPNVVDVYAYENNTNAVVNIGSTNYPTLPHSIYVAVSGGLSTDIANAIWFKKDNGCDYNGNTSVVVTDNINYSIPYPSYNVKYQIPTSLPVLFAIQITNNPLLPSNIVTLIQNAIVNAFIGADGGARARIGSTIFASRFYAPINLVNSNVSILSVLLGVASPTLNSITVGVDQFPTVVAANISVALI